MALKLWSKLENAGDVTAPQIGTGGAEVGSPTYNACKFNNGIEINADAEGADFPTVANSININKGTIEFWIKFKTSPTYSSAGYPFDFMDVSNGGMKLFFSQTQDDFGVWIYAGGAQIMLVYTVGLGWNVNDVWHFGITWDREGLDIGGGKTMAFYVNNVLKASSTQTWAVENTVLANMRVGCRADGSYRYNCIIDNLKTQDICKTDFSDRNQEDAGANQSPTAPTSLEVDGKSTPTGANCVTATPQFTAIFNDPDAGDTSNAIEIQVGSASGLSDMWDSGWLVDATVDGNRCNAKNYAGAALSTETSYWWRCRFRDDDNAEGAWSAWQEFYVCAVEPEPEAGLLECAPGGPLPKRCPFRCAVALPRRVPVWVY